MANQAVLSPPRDDTVAHPSINPTGRHTAADFLLAPTHEDDDFEFLAPVRKQVSIKPLIDGVSTYQAMEGAVANATKSIHLAFWIFNPDTPLQSLSLRRGNLSTWGNLLAQAANDGKDVRILLSDFDPILGRDLHRSAWSAYRRLAAATSKLNKSQRENLQVICDRHDAEIGGLIAKKVLEPALKRAVAGLNATTSLDAALQRFRDMPGLWKSIVFVKSSRKFAVAKDPELTLRPAVHHQKLCVIDGALAFCGGLDVNTGRIDTSAHADMLWHDIDCSFGGDLAADVERNFCGRWNRQEPAFRAFVKDCNAAQPGFKIELPRTSPLTFVQQKMPASAGTSFAQLHRTISKNTVFSAVLTAVFSAVPTVVRSDVQDSYKAAIAQAETFVYIENQYVRAPELADWLIQRHGKAPQLQVLVVLPVAPEEVTSPTGPDEITLHGLFLQHEVLARLRREFGKSLGLYSMVSRAPSPHPRKTDSCGSRQIYVHSKCLIVDDRFASIGSANATNRSFRVDSELGVAWFDPERSVSALRSSLWNELLGAPKKMVAWRANDYVREWDKIAQFNARAAPSKRLGFVVPHNPERFKGERSSRVPEKFAELLPELLGPEGSAEATALA